jgi:hypothetical protein
MDSINCIEIITNGSSKFKYFGGASEKDAMIQSM